MNMKLTIHRGTHEIGGSFVQLRAGDSRIILDVGILFSHTGRSLTGGCRLSRVHLLCIRATRWKHHEDGTTLTDNTEHFEEARGGSG